MNNGIPYQHTSNIDKKKRQFYKFTKLIILQI